MKTLLAASSILLATVSTAALAGSVGDTVVEAPVTYTAPAPAPSLDWTGFYGGVQLGYGDVNTDNIVGGDGDGAIGGIHGAYLYDYGDYVIGGEVDINAADIEFGPGGTGDIDSLTRLKLKAGYDFGNTLVYGILGAAYADTSIGGGDFSDTGFVVGAGVDYMFTPQWVVGGEVLYHDFGDDFDGTGVEVDATTVQMKVSYKF